MPVIRRLLAQDENEESQILLVDSSTRYIVNTSSDWQFLFGPFSDFTESNRILKVAAEFDTSDFDGMRIAAYLYDTLNAGIDAAGSVVFNIYVVSGPQWVETLVTTVNGTVQPNNYFFADVPASSLGSIDLDGDPTIMIEAVVTRLSTVYRDRIYVNQLGIYDSFFRLKQEVEFLDITKLDE